MLIHIAIKSLLYRKSSILLTIATISLSLFVMLGVDHVRQQAKSSFTSTVSGVDLIVGTRTGSLNLLLYSVFRLGTPTANIDWQSYKNLSENDLVSWAVPISLGDSHKGYRVLGTTPGYFKFLSYANKNPLRFKKGREFEDIFGLVLGASVANKLGYDIGDKITLSHGIGRTSFKTHDNLPFKVVGILEATGTPIDQTLHISLQGLEALHVSQPFSHNDTYTTSLKLADSLHLTPNSVTAVFVGLKSKISVFNFQRQINSNKNEPLSAILPGLALSQFWQSVSVFDNTLSVITYLVLGCSLIGLTATMLSSIRERTHELRLIKVIGATSWFVFLLIEFEALLITFVSTLVTLTCLSITLLLSREFVLVNYGITLDPKVLTQSGAQLLIGVFICTVIAAIPPAIKANRKATIDT